MSIASEISRIYTQKELLRQAMNNKGCSISQDATLESFVSAVNDITGGSSEQQLTLREQEKAIMDNLVYIDNQYRDANYFTMKFTESGRLYFLNLGTGPGYRKTISYNKNNTEWLDITSGADRYIEVLAGDEIWLKSTNTYLSSGGTNNYFNIFSTAKVYISGNLMSLINFGNFTGSGTYNYGMSYLFYNNNKLNIDINRKLYLTATNLDQFCYANMFSNCTNLTELPESLPATTLKNNCYYFMFNGCTGLEEIPSGLLPATTLADSCYSHMFDGCSSLITIPSNLLPATDLTNGPSCYNYMFRKCTGLTTLPSGLLPATTLAQSCYQYMFDSCTGLTELPSNLLPATDLTNGPSCYSYMFNNCTGLITLPSGLLPATTLANNCYSYMFWACTGLTELPSNLLPATTLANSCYSSMFRNCTGLITVPSNLLPATTLVSNCYIFMFYGCRMLSVAPDLPALTLVKGCYNNMFWWCMNLKSIKAYFTTTPGSSYTSEWLNGITGPATFYKNTNATWTTTGTSAVPTTSFSIVRFTP